MPTPLLPLRGILYSSRSSKSPYSFSVISQPPPPPWTYRRPLSLSAPQTSFLPSSTFQPDKSLPLNRAMKSLEIFSFFGSGRAPSSQQRARARGRRNRSLMEASPNVEKGEPVVIIRPGPAGGKRGTPRPGRYNEG